jgi:hypothetical protein
VKIWKIGRNPSWLVKIDEKYGRKVGLIVKWYGRNPSWIVKRYGKYGWK